MEAEANLDAVHRGWDYAATGAVIPGPDPTLFDDPCVVFGFALWHGKREVEARDAERPS